MSLRIKKRNTRDRRIMQEVGQRLRDLREECDLSRKDVQEHLNISKFALTSWEGAHQCLDLLELLRLCRLYQASPEYVLTGHEPRSDQDNPWLQSGPAWEEDVWPDLDEPTRLEERRQSPTAQRKWHKSVS